MKTKNPYTKEIIDEVSGIKVANNDYYIWEDGYKVGIKEMIDLLMVDSETYWMLKRVLQTKLKELNAVSKTI